MRVGKWAAAVCVSALLMGAAPPGRGAFDNALDWLWYGISPRTPDTAPGRALVQLGLPTPSTVTLWHLCPSEGPTCEVAIKATPSAAAVVQSPLMDGARRIVLEGYRSSAAVAVTVTTTWTVAGQARSRTDALSASTAPSADAGATFSFIAASCNETLHVHKNMNPARPALNAAQLNSLNLLRLRAQAKLRIDRLPDRPAFVLGLGDQVYMDAEWNEDPEGRGFALFRGKRSRDFAFPMAANEDYFAQELSRRTFAVPPLDSALRAVPLVAVWDDHELRDGFRNQGDEHEPFWARWYGAARGAYVRDQVLRNPHIDVAKLGAHEATPAVFSWGDSAHFFLLETRSATGAMTPPKGSGVEAEGVAARRVFGDDQWKAFTTWLETPRARPSVIVVGLPTPLTVGFGEAGIKLSAFDGEMNDDVADQLPTTGAHLDLARVLVRAFAKSPHRLLILSGDIHTSAVTRLKVNGRLIGIEVVSSGLAAARGKRDRLSAMLEGPTKVGPEGFVIDADSAGTLRGSPNFVEIRVRAEPNDAPHLEVFFFPSVGNLADKSEQDGLANPSAYLEANPGVWPSRRYVSTDPPTLPKIAFVGFPDNPDAGPPPADKKNLLHAGASVCVDYKTNVSKNPYFGSDWFTVFPGAGETCTILQNGPNLKPGQ